MGRRPHHRVLGVAGAGALLLICVLGAIAAGAGPPFPDRITGRYVNDTAALFSQQVRRAANTILVDLKSRTGADVVVYTQVKPASQTGDDAQRDAEALLQQWAVGGASGDGAVMLWDLTRDKGQAIVRFAAGPTFLAGRLDQNALDGIIQQAMGTLVTDGKWDAALSQGVAAVSVAVSGPSGSQPPATPGPPGSPGATLEPGATLPPGVGPGNGPTPPAGPPYPDPINNVTVYDYAGIFSTGTVASVTRTIAGIEARTGSEIVVYTQIKPQSDTPEEAERDAIALIDQWGVGRRGFDDGLAILFDLDRSRCHGQVQLYAGPGYRATFLSNDERQAIFENDMLPNLRSCKMDAALLSAMGKVDAAATPEHAQKLQTARQLDAALGLVVAPLALLGLVGWAGWSWMRYGKDPVYLDDPSILMPAPPPGMTAPAAALVMDGRASRHALTTAMVDLAARGEIGFKEDKGLLHSKVGVQLLLPDENDASVALYRRQPVDSATAFALDKLQGIGTSKPAGYIDPDDLLTFGKSVDDFDTKLDRYVAAQGWFREPPDKSVNRWSSRGAIFFILGVLGVIAGFNLPSAGLTLLGGALIVAAIAIWIIARVMPQRTMPGAMAYAMLAAYRRTLQKTLEQARSMNDVVASKSVPWIQTPDMAVVWGVAFGLHDEIEEVLKRSLDDVRSGAVTSTPYFPTWYAGSSGWSSASGGGGGLAPGLFSSGGLPDFGGMMSALSTVGNSPSSSGSGGSGGFGGGGSGGGGGGAGGGF